MALYLGSFVSVILTYARASLSKLDYFVNSGSSVILVGTCAQEVHVKLESFHNIQCNALSDVVPTRCFKWCSTPPCMRTSVPE